MNAVFHMSGKRLPGNDFRFISLRFALAHRITFVNNRAKIKSMK